MPVNILQSILNNVSDEARSHSFKEAMGKEENEARQIELAEQEENRLCKIRRTKMAKETEHPKIEEEEVIDKTPDQALRDDWPSKCSDIGRYITVNGKMRTGLKPSEQKKAKEILKSYGF